MQKPKKNSKTTRSERPPASQRDLAYEAIKRRIIDLTYKPGSYLNEAMIGDDLEFGKTPVRQAIDQLRLEGMLDVMPRKGLIVRPISYEEIRQIADVRLVLESYCAELAAERISAKEIQELEDVLVDAKTAAAAHDTALLMELDRRFHNLISAAANNPVLGSQLSGLHDRSLRFWFITLSKPKHVSQILKEHREIVESLKAHDSQRAKEAAQVHIRSFISSVFSGV